ncbi:glycoside hydrolase family 1 protein [Peptoniphilaceae bacterium SGI.131]
MLELKDLKLGVASASAQIEGGEVNSNWNTYSDLNKITDGANIKRATDHWNRWKEDADLLDELEIKHYRMSLEWARIEPKQGEFDQAVMDRYLEEILYLKNKGIEVLLTLYHFSHPQWFEDLNSFEKEENIDIFLRFVDYVIRQVGAYVKDFCTINEPNVYAVNSYFFGEWLQEEKNIIKTIKVMSIFATCHIEIYKLIKAIFAENAWGDSDVTFALHMRYFTPYKNNFINRLGVRLFNFLFQEGIFKASALGQFKFPFKNIRKHPKGQYLDSIGINYYSRGLVDKFSDKVKEKAYKNDLGWEIYPKGLAESAKKLYGILPLPIKITENGTCDNSDSFRVRFIYDHLEVLLETGLPVSHYYHWCFVDNFEWKEGEIPRFGIVHVDYESQKRTIKNSAYFYRELIRRRRVDEELYQNYVDKSCYHRGDINVLRGLLSEEELRNKR